ncbi:hypothetical protein [Clostridium saccharoperbutylacetonicum]|nr:hypothetical protein [Clostridium saccharoperbutylacetonicum]NSB30179.1 hypothetical protein [Clostridium saccharoperbutylacetonicum]
MSKRNILDKIKRIQKVFAFNARFSTFGAICIYLVLIVCKYVIVDSDNAK